MGGPVSKALGGLFLASAVSACGVPLPEGVRAWPRLLAIWSRQVVGVPVIATAFALPEPTPAMAAVLRDLDRVAARLEQEGAG